MGLTAFLFIYILTSNRREKGTKVAKNFRLTIGGTYQSQNWNNVFHYRSATDAAGLAADLVDKFQDELISALRGIMTPNCTINSVYAIDVPDTGDYAGVDALALSGQFGSASVGLPPNWTNCFVLNTSGSPIRHGFKRFAGCSEDAFTSGTYNATFDGAANTLSAKMDDVLVGALDSYTPIIPRYTGSPAVITLWTAVTGAYRAQASATKTRKPG